MIDVDVRSLLVDLTSGDDSRAEQAVVSLSRHGADILPSLQEMLKSPLADTRWWALRCLAQMEDPPVDLMIKSLEDVSQEVVQCAALAISHHPNIQAVNKLLECLSNPESVTTNLAATALIAIGKDSIPGMLEILPSLKGICRIEAFRAIASIGDQRAIPALMSALAEDSLSINYWAEEGLNRLGLDMVYMKPD